MIPLLSRSHRKVRVSGRSPERPFMRDTTLANMVARAEASDRAESAVTSPPPSLECHWGFDRENAMHRRGGRCESGLVGIPFRFRCTQEMPTAWLCVVYLTVTNMWGC